MKSIFSFRVYENKLKQSAIQNLTHQILFIKFMGNSMFTIKQSIFAQDFNYLRLDVFQNI